MSKLLKIKEAADLLGVTTRTIQRWVKSGRLYSQGSPMLVREADLASMASGGVVAKQGKVDARGPTMDVKNTDLGRIYVLSGGDIQVSLPEASYKKLVRMYSNEGGGANQDEVCAEFRLTRPELQVVLKAGGVTHTHLPFTDEEIVERPLQDLSDEMLLSRKQQLYRKAGADRRRETEKAAALWWSRESAVKKALDAIKGFDWAEPTAKPVLLERGPRMGILFPTDLHYGKYAPPGEPGEYNREKARDRAITHCNSVLQNAKDYGVTDITYYVGSDFFNADNDQGGTTKGTPQDNDGLMCEIAPEALALQVDILELARSYGFRVLVKACPGNHDHLLTIMTIAAFVHAYRNIEGVTVDPSTKKYGFTTWGLTLVMDTHGDGRHSTKDLMQVMATQQPVLWAECPYRYAIRGNLHHVLDQEDAGIRNLLFPSLGGSDAYHKKAWPVQSRPCIRMPIFDQARGLVATFESAAVWDTETCSWAA